MRGRVVLLRHGTTKLNRSGSVGASAERIRGWKDIPLDEQGERDVRAAAKKYGDTAWDRIWSSDLQRASDMADAIGKACGVAVVRTRDLRPWDLGDLAGKLVTDALPMMRKYADTPDKPIPGGESLSRFLARFLQFLDEQLRDAKSNGSVLLLVTHTRNIQAARAWQAKGRPSDYTIDTKTFDDYAHETKPGDIFEMPHRSSDGLRSVIGKGS